MFVIRVISVCFGVIGVVLLAFSVPAYRETSQFLADARRAEGTITEVVGRRTSGTGKSSSSTQYHYRVRYQTAGGQTVELVTEDSDSSPLRDVGDTVQLLYLPREPEKAVFEAFSWIWFRFGLLAILGGSSLGIGLCNLWITVKPAKTARTEARLGELLNAFRSGGLRRDSEYQGLLVAFTFVGFTLLAVALVVVLFAGIVWKVLFAGMMIFTVVSAVRGRRKGTSEGRKRK